MRPVPGRLVWQQPVAPAPAQVQICSVNSILLLLEYTKLLLEYTKLQIVYYYEIVYY